MESKRSDSAYLNHLVTLRFHGHRKCSRGRGGDIQKASQLRTPIVAFGKCGLHGRCEPYSDLAHTHKAGNATLDVGDALNTETSQTFKLLP